MNVQYDINKCLSTVHSYTIHLIVTKLWEVVEYSFVKVSVIVHLSYDRWQMFTQTNSIQLNINNDTVVKE